MNQIELYDILTLDNDEEYTVIKILEDAGNKYYLLAWTNEDEELNLEKVKIVKEVVKDNKIIVEEIDEEKEINRLLKLFLLSLKDEIE